MPDEPKKQPDDIEGILSDLDDILSGLGRPVAAAPADPPAASPAPAPAPPLKPIELPKPVEAAKPVEPPKILEPVKAVEAPKPIEPIKAVEPPPGDMKIELASREGALPTAPKKAEAPKLAETPKPRASDAKPPLELSAVSAEPALAAPPKSDEPPKSAEIPKAAEPSKPVEPPKAPEAPKVAAPPAAVPAASEEIPAATPKDQIRRVAYVHTFACIEARTTFAVFLSQAARTISKKPLFLRQVMTLEVDGVSDPNAIYEKARTAHAVAVLAVVEGWPAAKIEALSEACSRGGLQFRTVLPADVQKKSTAVDVIVDMMLLPGES
jgi:hypothetical protein